MRQLLAYRLDPGAELQGQLLGALERIESGGALRILDVVFVGRDATSGELYAVSAQGAQGSRLVMRLLDFRLGSTDRALATRRAFDAYGRGADHNPLVRMGEALAPGAALAAVLVEHAWKAALDDAARRSRGTCVLDTLVAESELTALASDLVAATERPA